MVVACGVCYLCCLVFLASVAGLVVLLFAVLAAFVGV